MARLARLVIPDHAHYVIQCGHSGQRVFLDAQDRVRFCAALHEVAAAEQVLVHAYALLDTEVQLLATPGQAASLGRLMQGLGRRYVAAYHRRHGGTGTLWNGRYRCAVVEPGAPRLDALLLVDSLSAQAGLTSAGHRARGAHDPRLVNPPEYWQLGNTPFEREAAYRELLVAGLSPAQATALRRAALGGWAAGSQAFVAKVADTAARPAQPRPRGRPRLPVDVKPAQC
jgi:putative transposase